MNPEIIFEDENILVVNKPAGLLVHPAPHSQEATFVDWIRKHVPEIDGVGEDAERPGIVHRLDRDVSGVMLVAKTQRAFDHLKGQFQNRTVDKEYIALVHGVVQKPDGEIRTPIGRKKGRGEMAARTDGAGKDALTRFAVERTFQRYSLLRVHILTGRTNQIRVHLRARSHPIVGDTRYGRKHKKEPIARPFLHASSISVMRLTGKNESFSAPLPRDLEEFLESLT